MSGRASWRRRLFKPVAVLIVVLVLLAGVALRRVIELGAEPTGDKDCGPAEPAGPGRAGLAPDAAPPASLAWAQRSGSVNDASCLSRTPVYGVVEVRSADDVRAALAFARETGLTVSAAGVKHSMGGQAFARDGIVLDMTRFNRMSLDEAGKVLTVQAGATWHDIQRYLHPRFAVKAMQSTDIFTVGGSIAVNAHGMDHRVGAVARTIRALRVMLADGSVHVASPTRNRRLFDLVVGGYGLTGVILDAELEVTDNVVYRSERRVVRHADFPVLFECEIRPDPAVGLMYGHLATAAPSFLDEMLLYTYREVDAGAADIPPLSEVSAITLRRLVFNLSKRGALPMRLKWLAEKHLEPRLESCPVSRNQALGEGEACLVSRNHPMHDSVKYLRNALPGETDILHEYFVPRDRFVAFVAGLRAIARESRPVLLNASVRVVHREDHVLTYAPTDMFAVVLYVSQSTDAAGTARMRALTGRLVDLALDLGGTFFLPYQLHYTEAQLRRAYPSIDAFFAAKRALDPAGVFSNAFYEKYGRR